MKDFPYPRDQAVLRKKYAQAMSCRHIVQTYCSIERRGGPWEQAQKVRVSIRVKPLNHSGTSAADITRTAGFEPAQAEPI